MGLHPYLKYVFWREVPLGIIVELVTREPNFSLKLLNVYRPYLDSKVLWDNLLHAWVLNQSGIIIGGDKNFTTSLREIWREK